MTSNPISLISIFGICQDLMAQGATDISLQVQRFDYSSTIEYELAIKGQVNGAFTEAQIICPRPCEIFSQG